MSNTALQPHQTYTAVRSETGVPDRLPTIKDLHQSLTDTDISPEDNLAVVLTVIAILGLIVCGFLIGHGAGFTAGKEAVCTETGWHSPSCKTEIYRRLYLKDPK